MSTTAAERIEKRPNAAAIKSLIAAHIEKKSTIAIVKTQLSNLLDFRISERELRKYIKELPTIVQSSEDCEDEDDEDSTNCTVLDIAKVKEMLNDPTAAAQELELTRYKLIAAISNNLDNNLINGDRLNGEYLKMLKTIEDIRKTLDIESQKNIDLFFNN